MKTPICLRLDDPTPVLSVYYTHSITGKTGDGRPVCEYYPNSFLDEFCNITEKWGIKGKFSIVPAPGNRGDIVNGIEGVSDKERTDWLDMVKSRVVRNFSITPEMLTHNMAVDVETGSVLSERENIWSQKQNAESLTKYLSRALSILKNAGFDCTGITSPWNFGLECPREYTTAVSRALWEVFGVKDSWFFLMSGGNDSRPQILDTEDGRTVVSLTTNTHDRIWQTMDTTDTSESYVSHVADTILTADGRAGDVAEVISAGGYPVIITHWQSLASNGLFTGLRVLDEVARRIEANFGDSVEWCKAEDIAKRILMERDKFTSLQV
ncbi:MAG: hypothetical protein IKV97_03505 [Clostridia bacterium]|nr:hypothetical protein [Clostridia bacterium]